jgi:SAM-dependent methyltransferase
MAVNESHIDALWHSGQQVKNGRIGCCFSIRSTHPMLRGFARNVYRRIWVLPKVRRTYGRLSIKDTFQRIYESKAWGDNGDGYCSGNGSQGEIVDRYCSQVIQVINDYKVSSILDLGCGDFTVARRIIQATGVRYIGVDVVPELIEHHVRQFSAPFVSFVCADISHDALPDSELCIVRQVFQHLSNDEINLALRNISKFPMCLISEHTPVHPKSFNRDKPHGPDIRLYYRSGVYVERPPFFRTIVASWEIPLEENSVLRTVLVRNLVAQSPTNAQRAV